MENSENEHQKVFSELLNTFNIQTEKLKKVMSIESKLQDKHNALQECYNRIANELKTAKLNENKLQCNLDECERNRKGLEKELVCIKVSYSIFRTYNYFENTILIFDNHTLHSIYILFIWYT